MSGALITIGLTFLGSSLGYAFTIWVFWRLPLSAFNKRLKRVETAIYDLLIRIEALEGVVAK